MAKKASIRHRIISGPTIQPQDADAASVTYLGMRVEDLIAEIQAGKYDHLKGKVSTCTEKVKYGA